MQKRVDAIAILIGTIIGAGLLGIPYVVAQSGFVIGLLNIIIITAIMIFVYLYLSEIGLRTKNNHQLTGYASIYLGKKGKLIMFLALAFGIYASLTAYLIGEGQSLSFLFFNSTHYSIYFALGFWLLQSFLSFFGLNSLKKEEKLGVSIVLILIALIVVLFAPKIQLANLTYSNSKLFFIPFGVIIFAFLGFDSIPEVERTLAKDKKFTKKAVIAAVIFAAIIYSAFAAIVVGTQGNSTPEIATFALGKIFVLLGILTMFNVYLSLSNVLIDAFKLDYEKPKKIAWLSVAIPPLLIFLFLNILKKASFISILSVGGTITGTLTVIIILIITGKAKKKPQRKPEYSIPYSKTLAIAISLVLIIAAAWQIWNLF